MSEDHSKSKASDAPAASAPPPGSRANDFAIVGIGASAGGLEAFEQFFRALPADSGQAYVVVSHLDPSHVSLLSEILQRSTALPVIEANDQQAVEADHVYVIPPNREMAIFHATLQLSTPATPRGQRLPIDDFLISLADDQGPRAVGIILSGTGNDGTQGLLRIQAKGGLTLVQEPASAKYDGMPTSAIEAGCASRVLAVPDMPAALLAAERQRVTRGALPAAAPLLAPPATLPASGINRLLMALRAATGHDFSSYKQSTISRRIERRMAQHDLTDTGVYLRYLKENPAEMQVLFKELLINVTSFFRDPEAFVALKDEILPQLLAGKPEDYVFRVWVAGCASGEEAYSIAILLREAIDLLAESHQSTFSTQIYATDLDDDAIATARVGHYPLNIAADVSPERLRRFFTRDETGFRIKKEIREMVVFAVQNVIKDPPFTKLDLLSCRNLMIYLEPDLQNRLIPTFHYALKPGGMLLLSSSESIGNHAELFTAVNRKWKIYRAEPSANASRALINRSLAWQSASGKIPEGVSKAVRQTNFAELAMRVLLKAYAPASVVADRHGNILYVYGETGKYLRPAPGQASLNLVDMAREGLPMELRMAMQCAVSQGQATLARELSVKTNGDFQTVSLSVRPLADEARQGLLLVSFQDLPQRQAPAVTGKHARRPRPGSAAEMSRIEALESELNYTREKLQITSEEQQSTNEELKSGNEELQSINEELQSTNEELETSKEELQSLNEELITVNAELQGKIEQLADMQNDLKNLLDNINVGTIFLDQHLLIRRFTRDATQAYRLAATDIGRPLADIKSQLIGDDLLERARAVLDTLVPWESELQSASGTRFLARVQPYRTLDNFIGGVVLTFTDISQRVEALAAQVARELAEAIVDSVREPLLVLDSGLQVVSASRSFYQCFAVSPSETLGRAIYDLGDGQWNIAALRELLENVLPSDQSFDGYVVDSEFPVIGHRRLLLNARRVVGKLGAPPLILLAMEPG
ncbi:MAG: SAM-dependent methyltransferase [Proteobacteria bacterium]|nr:SAM-dependent methyltransferase [Pseudomonadota bacterium]